MAVSRGLRLSATLSVFALSLSALSACSSSDASRGDRLPSDPAPAFDGPYAEEYRQAWISTDETFIRDVLEDQAISEQEWAEVQKRFGDCFASRGVELLEYEPDGAYSIDPGDMPAEESNELLIECEATSGEAIIGRIRRSEQRNPQNRDIDEVMHECLVRSGAVPASYSLEDYRRDNPSYAFPFTDERGDSLYDDCVAAPLTAERDE